MHNSRRSRVLAVVVRSGRFGYATFETPTRLLDFGVSSFVSRLQARTRIRDWFMKFRVSVLVVDNGGRGVNRNWRRVIVRMIRRQARNAAVQVEVISPKELHAFFHEHGKTNKYEFADLVSSWFPELAWKVPPTPKFYDPEPSVMTRIDAVILGAVYLKSTTAAHNDLTPLHKLDQ